MISSFCIVAVMWTPAGCSGVRCGWWSFGAEDAAYQGGKGLRVQAAAAAAAAAHVGGGGGAVERVCILSRARLCLVAAPRGRLVDVLVRKMVPCSGRAFVQRACVCGGKDAAREREASEGGARRETSALGWDLYGWVRGDALDESA
jgi:hypothetical protein